MMPATRSLAALLLAAVCLWRCSEAEDALSGLTPILGDSQYLNVLGSLPFPGQVNVTPTTKLTFTFNKSFDTQKCISALTVIPATAGFYLAGGNVLEFTPNAQLSAGIYTATLSKDCEDLDGRDLEREFTTSFAVGQGITPAVQAVGLASQACSATFPGVGSATGGDHTLASCWWDSSLSILSPTNYEFRGNSACADAATDNIRVIFNAYMNPGVTINAITLTRQSPPFSTVRKATWLWSDCQSSAPFGCRVVTVAFTEEANACGGAGFGGNDFNLEEDLAALGDFPLYLLEVDTSAESIDGANPAQSFVFGIEGD